VAAAEHLKDYPELGRVVPELNLNRVRELIFQNYRIVYSLRRAGIVSILAVAHSSMDMGRRADEGAWHLI